jgi:hypothetical protein
MTPDFVLFSFDVKHQVRNSTYRAACLDTLAPGDVVQAIHPETGAILGTRLLGAIDRRWDASMWPQKYVTGNWRADSEGHELDSAQERVEMGWVLVRPPLTADEAAPGLDKPKQKPPFSWALYERHMRLMHLAVLHGFAMPEEPWA